MLEQLSEKGTGEGKRGNNLFTGIKRRERRGEKFKQHSSGDTQCTCASVLIGDTARSRERRYRERGEGRTSLWRQQNCNLHFSKRSPERIGGSQGGKWGPLQQRGGKKNKKEQKLANGANDARGFWRKTVRINIRRRVRKRKGRVKNSREVHGLTSIDRVTTFPLVGRRNKCQKWRKEGREAGQGGRKWTAFPSPVKASRYKRGEEAGEGRHPLKGGEKEEAPGKVRVNAMWSPFGRRIYRAIKPRHQGEKAPEKRGRPTRN